MPSQQLIRSVQKHEGCKLKVYKCPAGKWTLGWGRNVEEVGITQSEADTLLMNDLYRCLAEAEEIVGKATWESLSEPRKDVLVEMVFQLGKNGVQKFSMMIEALRRMMYKQAAEQMLRSRWHDQTPERCEELANIMATGTYE